MIVFGLDYSLFYLTDADIHAQSLILKHSLSLLACITVKVHRRFQNYLLTFLTFWFVLIPGLANFIVAIVALHILTWLFSQGQLKMESWHVELLCGPPQHLVTCSLRWRSGLRHLQHSTAGECLLSDTGDVIVDPLCLVYQILSGLPSLALLDRGLGFIASSSSGTFVS